MCSYLVYQTLNIIFCVVVYMQYKRFGFIKNKNQAHIVAEPFSYVRACGIAETMCILLDNEENCCDWSAMYNSKCLDCSTLQGTMIELTETCPNIET